MIDTRALLERIDLRALAEEAGAQFRNGRGASSACPLHQGNNPNAFHLYQGQDGMMRWHCFTNCPQNANDGDAIGFYMRWRGVDFRQAAEELGRRAGVTVQSGEWRAERREQPSNRPIYPMATTEAPSAAWQARAMEFCEYASTKLWSPTGESVREILHESRGLTDETIRAWGLGWNPKDIHDDPARWGLEVSGRVWCPAGIVIPGFHEGGIWYVKVRRLGNQVPKYAGPSGGRGCLFGAYRMQGRPTTLLTEGEFDAMLAWQECADLVDVATLGGATQRLRALDAVYLLRARRVLAAYDADQAGSSGGASLAALSRRVTVVTPPAHDITDVWREKGREALRQWVEEIIAGGADGGQ